MDIVAPMIVPSAMIAPALSPVPRVPERSVEAKELSW